MTSLQFQSPKTSPPARNHLTWHHLRHNAGSYLLSENVPITAVSKILGHANPAITMNIYAHELEEDLDCWPSAKMGHISGLN
ncbi:hypothetical protein FIL92_00220 [SAR202 cluster bacterium AD-812-D07_MRT_10900m]|nr:hypothetical protein [SAR202 cluster bacterium AD-812-D07_MRT_10900m]